MSVLSPRSPDRVVPIGVAFTTILFLVSASSSGMVVVKETETTSPLYKPVSRDVEEMAVFFHQVNLSFLKTTTVYIEFPLKADQINIHSFTSKPLIVKIFKLSIKSIETD